MKILIVDDSKAMRMIVRRQLGEIGLADAEYIEAANGVDGIAAIKEHQPDLVLSDWNMPEMNGLEALVAIRAAGIKAPFGFVTTEGTPEMRKKAEDAGAMFLITKPFTAESFRDVLDPILR
jgi:two-component system chemotaxis response regulator CheY